MKSHVLMKRIRSLPVGVLCCILTLSLSSVPSASAAPAQVNAKRGAKPSRRKSPIKRPKGGKRTDTGKRSSPTRTTRGRNTEKTPRPPVRGTAREPTSPTGASEPVTSRLNINAEDEGKPPEERTYRFSIVDGSYKDLVENFARMAGIGILGEAPVGPVTFVTTETMDFKTALNRIRLLLFKYKPIEPYWLLYQDKNFEVLRVTDVWRFIDPRTQIFPSLAEFEASNIDDNELAMLRYTPAATSVADFTMLRDFMPDYVRIAPMAETNSLSIFALVKDIKKYLSLIKLFESAGDDPRVLAKLPIEFLSPSEAVDKLRRLMDNDLGESASNTRGRKGAGKRGTDAAIDLPGQRTILFPDDALGVIIIRAVPKKIEDVKKMLTFVDVAYPDNEYEPVLIPIVNADVNEILAIVNPLITGSNAPAAPANRRGKAKKGSRAIASTSTARVSLMADTRTNTLVVRGAKEEVERVQRYVALFDVQLPDDRPLFVKLQYATADTLAGTITQIIVGSGKRTPRGEGVFSAVAEPLSNSLILTGNKKDVRLARFLIEKMDVGEESPTLHSYRFRNAFPSSVMDIIVLLESQQAGASPAKPKGRRKSKPGASGNLHADDVTRTLYVVCSDEDWTNKYLPLIESMDEQAGDLPTHVSIPVEHLTPEEVIQTLTKLFSGPKPGKGGAGIPKMAPAGKAVLISSATAAQIRQMQSIIADIDRAAPEREQRMFTFDYADPEEIKAVIETGVVVPKITPRRAGKPGGAITRDAVVLTVFGKTLIAGGMREQLDEISELVEKLDVPAPDDNEMRVYVVPPGHDVQSVVALLESLLANNTKPVRTKPPGAKVASFDGTRIAAQVSTRRILVSAPVSRFPEIEKTIQTLLEGEPPARMMVKFITLVHADPAAVAELIQPILQQRMNEMVSSGEIAGEQEDPKKRRTAMKQTGVNLTPDVNNERIIVTGPATIIAEAEALVAELDRPSSDEDRIMRTINLARTTPDEMVSAISTMISGERTSNKPKRPRLRPKGKKKNGGRSVFGTSSITDDVTIVSAPGGSSVILSGTPEAVDEVERWVKQLDDTATTEKVLKIYSIVNADVEQLADAIMDMCDTVTPKPGKRGAASPIADLGFEPLGGVRKGGEITLTTDYWNKKILVRATPIKLFEVDRVVELYDGKEGAEPEMSTSDTVPYLIYELKHTDPYEATLTLENVLEVVWTHGDTPSVDYIAGTDNLVIKVLPEHNAEILRLIEQYVDKDSGKPNAHAIVYETITGTSASEFAMRLKMAIPGLNIKLEQLGEDLPVLERLRAYQKCVLPASLMNAAAGALLVAPTQATPTDETDDHAKLAKELADSLKADDTSAVDDATDASTEQVSVYFDDRQGVIVIKGPPRAVDEVKDALEEIKEEIESSGSKPDIRIFRIRYRNVNVAANILESMFNAPRARTPQRGGGAAAQQKRLQQMQQRMQQMQQQMRGQAGAQSPAGAPGKDGAAPGQAEEIKKKGTSEIRVTPDPQTRSLIIRAATEDFPIIVDLLATIDRPAEVTEDFRIFKLENLVAAEVEDQLKVLLGVSKAPQKSRRQATPRGGRKGGAQNAAMQQIEDALLNISGAGGGAIDAASDITITSYAPANTLLVKAPEAALDLIASLIEKLEAQEVPSLVTRTYYIKNGDAMEIVERINAVYGGGGGSRGGGRGKGRGNASQSIAFDPTNVTQVTATADARTNTVFISAFEPDFEKIETLIEELDRETDDAHAVQTYVLHVADATEVATTLNSIYGSGARRGQRGGSAGSGGSAKFVGDAASNTLFYTAPANKREDILTRITELDAQAGQRAKPKVIKLTQSKPSDVARALQDAFAGGKRGGGMVKIIGDDASKQLIITAPDDLYAEIETLAHSMDQISTNVLPRVFKLEHARATEVHAKLMEMVQALGQQLPKREMDVFTAVADDRANTIVAICGPKAFLLVQQVIREIDVPKTNASEIEVIALHHNDAEAMKLVLETYLAVPGQTSGGRRGGGRSGTQLRGDVRISANYQNNTLIISGNAIEVEELKATIAALDVEIEGAGNAPKIIQVVHGRATQIEPILSQMFANQKRRGGKGQSNTAMPPVIAADEASNTLIVRASASDLGQIETLITELDTEAGQGTTYTIIPVTPGLQLTDLALMVETTINEGERIKAERWSVPPGTIVVTPDTRAGALVVAGTESLFPDVEKLVKRMEEMGPVGGITTTVINPKNLPPDELRRLLEQVINDNASTTQSGSRAKGRSGSRVKGRSGASRRKPTGKRNTGGRRSPKRGGTKRR